MMKTRFSEELKEHQEIMANLVSLQPVLEETINLCARTLQAGAKIMFCGNGGSAADAQHLAAELVVRYRKNRHAYAGLALTTDASALTACGNDFDFASIFERQLGALGNVGDVVFLISTSGTSENVLRAGHLAREKKIHTVAITGAIENPLGAMAQIHWRIPSNTTARIQEAYLFLGHLLCGEIENRLTNE